MDKHLSKIIAMYLRIYCHLIQSKQCIIVLLGGIAKLKMTKSSNGSIQYQQNRVHRKVRHTPPEACAQHSSSNVRLVYSVFFTELPVLLDVMKPVMKEMTRLRTRPAGSSTKRALKI